MKLIQFLFLAFIILVNFSFAQDEEPELTSDTTETIEVYLIDNYVKGDKEKILILSWMTNIPVKSKVEIQNIGVFNVSDTLTDFHQTQIDLNKFTFDKEENYFKIISELEDGTKVESDEYSFSVPVETIPQTETKQVQTSSSYYLYNFLLGVSLWLLPSPSIAIENNDAKFALIKDLPLISIGSSSAYKTFPYVYFYVGYSHIFDRNIKNAFRFGGKYLYELKELKHFISLGIGGFTNFKGSQGISSDIGFSFLKVLNTFELYTSYSYNYLPNQKSKFHFISLGLFTSSFSINLNY